MSATHDERTIPHDETQAWGLAMWAASMPQSLAMSDLGTTAPALLVAPSLLYPLSLLSTIPTHVTTRAAIQPEETPAGAVQPTTFPTS